MCEGQWGSGDTGRNCCYCVGIYSRAWSRWLGIKSAGVEEAFFGNIFRKLNIVKLRGLKVICELPVLDNIGESVYAESSKHGNAVVNLFCAEYKNMINFWNSFMR